MRNLERLTYVHDGDPGPVGTLIAEVKGVLRFGEGSGLIELGELSTASPPRMVEAREVRIVTMARSMLPSPGDEMVGDEVPCILGHSGPDVVMLVPPRSIARVTGGLNDLRGKIRFGVAKVGWGI